MALETFHKSRTDPLRAKQAQRWGRFMSLRRGRFAPGEINLVPIVQEGG